MLNFFQKCAADPRFNADELFCKIEKDATLSLSDKALYRYMLMPPLKRAFLEDPGQVLLSPRSGLTDKPSIDSPFADPESKVLRNYIRQRPAR